MTCEVVSVQGSNQQFMAQDAAMPAVQAMQQQMILVPVMMFGVPSPVQTEVQAQAMPVAGISQDYGQWMGAPGYRQMAPVQNYVESGCNVWSDTSPGAAGYNGSWQMGEDSSRKRAPRSRQLRAAQPKAPGIQAARRSEEDAAVPSKERCDELRTTMQEGGKAGLLSVLPEIRGKVWALSRDANGCRVVQLAMEKADNAVAKELVAELHGHVREAVVSPHANYVVQKVISGLSTPTSAFIADELFGNGARFARHRFGCRIMCRLLEHCSKEEGVVKLIEEVLEDREEALDLCQHNFGHHVVQSVLEHGGARFKELIAEVLCADLLNNASHRSASYVVESALSHCLEKDQQILLHKLQQPALVAELAQARYGFYVAKNLLQRPEVDAQALAQSIPAVAALMATPDFAS